MRLARDVAGVSPTSEGCRGGAASPRPSPDPWSGIPGIREEELGREASGICKYRGRVRGDRSHHAFEFAPSVDNKVAHMRS